MKGTDSEESEDTYLEKRLARYDRWVKEGKIPYSSKVIPVGEPLETKQWVLPTEQVIEFLRNARSFALTNCVCRSHYQRCDNPLGVCFFLNDAADRYMAKGIGRYISLNEAVSILRQANEKGLVHLTVYNPEQYVYTVCSCCSCCCHDIQFLKLYGRSDLITHSEYIAETDMDACNHCGDCIERCVF
ncbi:MAG: hypothetical protein SVM80_11780 [Halobacteriota archaeon]|nr:hypothetical protein [Halobacteriota archaeon]